MPEEPPAPASVPVVFDAPSVVVPFPLPTPPEVTEVLPLLVTDGPPDPAVVVVALDMPAPVEAGPPVVVIPVVVTPSSVPAEPSGSGPSPLHPSRTLITKQAAVVVCGSLHAERGIESRRGRFMVKLGQSVMLKRFSWKGPERKSDSRRGVPARDSDETARPWLRYG